MRSYVKRNILTVIDKKAGLNISQITKETGFSYVTVFSALTMFRQLKYVETHFSGTNRLCNITPSGVEFLKHLRNEKYDE
jgi:predicted transcriptional regulator